MAKAADGWLRFAPRPVAGGRALEVLLKFAREVCTAIAGPREDRQYLIEAARKRATADSTRCEAPSRQALVVAISVLSDLASQGWLLRVTEAAVLIRRPVPRKTAELDQRASVRERLHAARNEQLGKPVVQDFIRDLETRRFHQGRFTSIFSLMRDGVQLAGELLALRDGVVRAETVVRPYLQFVNERDRCEHTGLKLTDIWRYFRYTWASPAQSIPGRSMMILVRDAAGQNHPVIGIAALSSAPVAITARDAVLGWTAAGVVEWLRSRRGPKVLRSLRRVVDTKIADIYKVDLIRDEVVSVREIREPTVSALARLREEATEQRIKHHRLMKGNEYKRAVRSGSMTWEERAQMALFRSKRALELAELLAIRSAFRRVQPGDGVDAILNSKARVRAILALVKRIKADRVGSTIAELSVCGAIPPYNEILGGKLVAMLVASPEVRAEYQRRYGRSESIIASAIAGRPVVKVAHLVFVGTTSLYRQRPSQYDRISVPVSSENVRYEYLGETKGVGTFQFSDRTARAMELLLEQSGDGASVNSVFGEGVNPRLRKMRGAFEVLGLPSDALLQHGSPRLVYGLRLARNVREYVLGIDAEPEYFIADETGQTATERIADWWVDRWLLKRIQRKDVIERVEQQSLIHPIRHGARVPVVVESRQGHLFED